MIDRKLILEFNKVFYAIEADSYDEDHPEVIKGNINWWQAASSRFLNNEKRTKPIRILDIGSGTGLVADIFKNNLADSDRFICYDLSTEMLKYSSGKLGGSAKNFGFFCGDAENIPFQSGSFDVITMNAILHHLPECDNLFTEVNRLLNDKGFIIIAHEPNKRFFNSFFLRFISTIYKFIGCGKTMSAETAIKMNRELKKRKLITEDLSSEELLRMVEFNSPVEQANVAIDKSKGFFPDEIIKNYFPDYKLLELREYSTFFIRPVFENQKWLSNLIKFAGETIIARGNLFSLIIQKQGIN